MLITPITCSFNVTCANKKFYRRNSMWAVNEKLIINRLGADNSSLSPAPGDRPQNSRVAFPLNFSRCPRDIDSEKKKTDRASSETLLRMHMVHQGTGRQRQTILPWQPSQAKCHYTKAQNPSSGISFREATLKEMPEEGSCLTIVFLQEIIILHKHGHLT